MTYIGIDVSKATFVVAYSSAKTGRTKTFKNTVKGVREFIVFLIVWIGSHIVTKRNNRITIFGLLSCEFIGKLEFAYTVN